MTASSPIIAVVTPVYNGERFLAETMDCVQAQTYPHVVHVVLDNCSTDGTAEIIKRYADARVPVITGQNPEVLDMGSNWNAALKLIPEDAEYFRILCADDLMTPDFCERMVETAERHPDMLVVGCKVSHREEDTMDFGWEADRETFPGKEAVRRYFDDSGVIIAHQTIMRRRILAMREVFFEPGMTTNDTDAVLDVLRHGAWGFVQANLGLTREHDDTDTSKTVRPMRMDLCEHLVLLDRHARFGLGEAEGERMLRTYRRYYVRKLMRWAVRGERDIFNRHLSALKRMGFKLTPAHFADAAIDWPLIRLNLRPAWTGRLA
ncbi:MAG: glycosyltransferase family 2 protein [Hyphomonadaceae bacterium]